MIGLGDVAVGVKTGNVDLWIHDHVFRPANYRVGGLLSCAIRVGMSAPGRLLKSIHPLLCRSYMIYLLGDVLGNFAQVQPAVQADKTGDGLPKTVIFLGDLQAQRPLEEEVKLLIDAGIAVWFIHGNHDTDSREEWECLVTVSCAAWTPPTPGTTKRLPAMKSTPMVSVFLATSKSTPWI
jgi:hypothetical protein